MSGKFQNLSDYFAACTDDEITLSYSQIEMILGFKLKESAYSHPAYLSNDTTTHAICKSWLDNGYESFNNKLGTQISFRKIKKNVNPVTYWLLPSNEDNYDIEKAYLEYHTIDWHQTDKNVAINDIVYIYETRPQQIVRFKAVVIAVNKKSANKKDLDCYRDSTPFENKSCYMTLKFLGRIEDVNPTMKGLQNAGIPVIRRLMTIPDIALKYIEQCENEDRDAQRFDGSIPSDIPQNHWSFTGYDEEELKERTENEARSLSDEELFGKAKQYGTAKPKERITKSATYVRNTYVAEASKRRANGICQLCGNPAPFTDKSGNPYLESHHIIWLSEGGADVLENTAALCPNCHKKMHIVNDAEDVKKLQNLNKVI